ncbi:MAG: methionyl-tRNA formyltransferase, partial [Gaiellaceae bacterium]|nr:methionyl-tRNA formyltransferase [Gaiellaceae bacterium]
MVPPAPWRVVIATRILPIALGFSAALREAGHEPVALLTVRDASGRYGGFDLSGMLDDLPPDLDVLIPARRASMAPLLASVRPDLVACTGFPWKIPGDALAVPSLGWINGHPSLLPRHRGPVPVAWTIRNGEDEIGTTIHRMDADLDTGAILAQRTMPMGEYTDPEEFYGRLGPLHIDAFKEALAKLAAGEEGAVQGKGGYEGFFTDDDALLDFARPAAELHRLVWAWRYAIPKGELHGALAELDGETVRVLASSLTEVAGARCVECADAPLWLVKTEPV